MPLIGHFTRDESGGFIGNLDTLLLHQDIIILPAEPSDAENAPDFRIHLRHDEGVEVGPEIGAGWKRTGERAGDYIALVIDDPALPQPIRANLFRDDDGGASWSLHWNRAPKRGERE